MSRQSTKAGRVSLQTWAFRKLMQARGLVGDLFLFPPPYAFIPAGSVRKQTIESSFNGHEIVIEADHTTPLYDMVAEIVDYDCYQLAKLPLADSKDPVIIDVGANIGVFSVVVSAICGGKGRIYAYEPIARNCSALENNINLNGARNVSIMPFALGCGEGKIDLVLDPEVSVSARGARYKSDSGAPKVTVERKSLRNVLHELGGREIDLIKMDCEGCEYELLGCLQEEDVRRVKAMTFELHTELFDWKKGERNGKVRSVLSKLQDWGYSTTYKAEMFGRRELHHVLAVRQ